VAVVLPLRARLPPAEPDRGLTAVAPADAACAQCALPLGRRPVVGTVDGETARFCCYGCLLVLQVTRARGDGGAASAILVRLGLATFFAMNVMMLSLPTYVPWIYGPDAGPTDGPLFTVLRVLALAFTAPVLLLLGGPIVAAAWRGLAAGGANADALIVVGTAAAYGLSVANTVAGRPAVYFDIAAMLLVLVTLGRWLEARARAEAGAAVRARLAPGPAEATRLGPDGAATVPPAALVPGDEVLVGPGAAFPTDGVVVDGIGGVDESALTGESVPVVKEPGAAIAGGTCSVDGRFRVRVTAPAARSAAARIAALIAGALAERTAAERTADRAARWLGPCVVGAAAAAGVAWTRAAGADRGILVALAVLVVACPCALGIATPVAIWMGIAGAVRRGVIVRSGAVLERVASVDRVLFDKTGTLTDHEPQLAACDPAAGSGLDGDALLARAAALEQDIRHPFARAIVAAAHARRLVLPAVRDVRAVPGLGVRGVVDGRPTAVGSARFAGGAASAVDAAAIAVLQDGRVVGTLRVRERARESAAEALGDLRDLGVRTGLLTGDARADAVVPALVPAADAALGLLPADKVARVRAACASGGATAMVGDGINDAPALAAADVGVAVGQATDLARLTADVVLLSGDLRLVPWLVAHARRVRRVARENLVWAFGYNAVAVGLAAAGALNPLVASLAMLGSSVAVVANARRLAR